MGYDRLVRYAFVTTNLVDLRAGPRFESERLSQMFFGSVVETGTERNGYVRVTEADGYAGWADQRFLQPIPQQAASAYRRHINGVVIAAKARLHSTESRSNRPPHFLYYGTPLCHHSSRRGLAKCLLPDGSFVRLKQNCIRPIMGIKKEEVSRALITRQAKRFLGVPYLWGGISPAGFDCSGLVRTVFGSLGIYLPRDTKDQIRCGRRIEREAVKTGDLLFFQRHVAIALGHERIVHSSAGGSGVRVNSLRPGDDDYRADLDDSFAMARRIL